MDVASPVEEQIDYFSPQDREINPLTNISIQLKNASEIEVPFSLYQAQMRINKLWDLTFSLLDGKYGWTRSKVLGGMFNYSGRNVIILDTTLGIDQVDMCYKSFIKLFSGPLIKRIVRDKGWTITRATNFIQSKFEFDEYIHRIMMEYIKEEEPRIILNRNPTITYGSILLMRIRSITEHVTLSIPSSILPGLNADFDGDALNVIAILLPEVAEIFEGFSPINMILDRVTKSLKLDISAMENITLAILTDR